LHVPPRAKKNKSEPLQFEDMPCEAADQLCGSIQPVGLETVVPA
jgi:hypothetical protein